MARASRSRNGSKSPRSSRRQEIRKQRCSQRRVARKRKRQLPSNQRRSRQVRHTATLYRHAIKRMVSATYRHLLHAKQVLSLFMIAYGILNCDRLGVAAVGTAMARAFGTDPKHGIKQVDRCLSNGKLDPKLLQQGYVVLAVGARRSIAVNLDWTEFDHDDHTTISVSLVTRARRAIPLMWLTVEKSRLKNRQRKYEQAVLQMLKEALPQKLRVVVLADRGFGDVKLYRFIKKTLGFDFVIRYKANIYIEWQGALHRSGDLVPRNGRIRVLTDTKVTAKRRGPFTIVLTKAADMKEPWCLATSMSSADGKTIVTMYGCRFQCEEAFRDLKDRRYGYGLSSARIRDCKRRDRLLLLYSLANLILLLVGMSSEKLGFDKTLRANTARERTHSLVRQGRDLLGNLPRQAYARLSSVLIAFLTALLASGFCDVEA